MTNNELATSLREFAEDIRKVHAEVLDVLGMNVAGIRVGVDVSFAAVLDGAAKALTVELEHEKAELKATIAGLQGRIEGMLEIRKNTVEKQADGYEHKI